MKIFLAPLAFVLLFSSCADKTAFSRFEMSNEQELAASSLQSSKIVSGENVDGVFSSIYLNEIYPERFQDEESFYLFLYLKTEKENFNITLNGKAPIKIEKLPHANEFSHLVSIENEWNNYYFVSFKKDSQSELNLQLESGPFSSAVLKYQKDQE